MIARRNKDDVYYDLRFPKTGGGEDIDFCRKKRQYSLEHGGEGFYAAPNVVVTHPWWHGGKRSYRRFYMWSVGDGSLVKMFPLDTYIDYAPNGGELILLCTAVLAVAVLFNNHHLIVLAGKSGGTVIFANLIHDLYRHLSRNESRTRAINSTVDGTRWVLAIMESTFIRLASEIGRVVGMLARGELTYLGRRFDWFTGRVGNGPRSEERLNNLQRMFISVAILAYCVVPNSQN